MRFNNCGVIIDDYREMQVKEGKNCGKSRVEESTQGVTRTVSRIRKDYPVGSPLEREKKPGSREQGGSTERPSRRERTGPDMWEEKRRPFLCEKTKTTKACRSKWDQSVREGLRKKGNVLWLPGSWLRRDGGGTWTRRN